MDMSARPTQVTGLCKGFVNVAFRTFISYFLQLLYLKTMTHNCLWRLCYVMKKAIHMLCVVVQLFRMTKPPFYVEDILGVRNNQHVHLLRVKQK